MTLRLTAGNKGFRHLITRHLPQYFEGASEAVIKKTTFWPNGTNASNVLQYLDEAIRLLDDKIVKNALSPEVKLSNGIVAQLWVAADGRIASFFPVRGPGVTWASDVLSALK